MANELYTIQKSTITPLFDQIRRITETEDAMTFEGATESLLNITPGSDLPNAEEAVFGSNDSSVEFGIKTISEDSISIYGSQSHVITTMKANEALSIVGLRFYTKTTEYTTLDLCNENDEILFQVPLTLYGSAKQNVWNTFYCDTPINIAVGETFKLKSNQSLSSCVKLSDVEINGKLQYVSSNFEKDTSKTRLHGLIDVIISSVSDNLPDNYQIQRTTVDDIANEVKRISGATGKMTTTQMLTALQSITLQDKTVTPTAEVQTVTPDDDYYALSSITVEAITEDNEAVIEIVNDELGVIENGTY